MSLLAPIYNAGQTLLARLTSGRASNLDLLGGINTATSNLDSRLTSARAGYIDDINTGVNNLESALTVDRLNNIDLVDDVQTLLGTVNTGVDTLEGRLTAARAGYLDSLADGSLPGTIKSIQRGNFAFNSDLLISGTITITEVNPAKSYLITQSRFGYVQREEADGTRAIYPLLPGIEFTSGTTLSWWTFNYTAGGTIYHNSGVCYWQVIEHW